MGDGHADLIALPPYAVEISIIPIPLEVGSVLKSFPFGKKKPGPNGGSSRKELPKEFAFLLCMFFNRSPRQGEVWTMERGQHLSRL